MLTGMIPRLEGNTDAAGGERAATVAPSGRQSISSAQAEGVALDGTLISGTKKETDLDRETSLALRRCSAYIKITLYRPLDPRAAQLLLICLLGPNPLLPSAYPRQTRGRLA